LGLRNYGHDPLEVRLAFAFDSDFADLFEVRGTRRNRRGVVTRRLIRPDRVVLTCQGLDGELRHTTLIFDPAPAELDTGHAAYAFELRPGESRPIYLTIDCQKIEDRAARPFLRGLRASRRELRVLSRDITTVETSNDIFNEVLCQSTADLHMLITETPQGRYPYAGIPWYSTTFGRDGLI